MNDLTPVLIDNDIILSSSQIDLQNHSTELARKSEKTIDVTSDERFTRISIDRKYFSKDNHEVYIKTLIVKDKELKTTETHTKKVFIHNTLEKSNMIIREIFTDRYNQKSTSEHKSLYVNVDCNENLFERIQALLGNPIKENLQLVN